MLEIFQENIQKFTKKYENMKKGKNIKLIHFRKSHKIKKNNIRN